MSDAHLDYSDRLLDTRSVRRSFDRAAAGYDSAAVLHAQVRGELLERLRLMSISPKVVLDGGAGTGHASRALKGRYPGALVVALDASLQMLRHAGRQRGWLRRFSCVCADAQCLPLADASVDLIVSNLMLHWCDPDAVLSEFRRVLAPRGLLCFSTFGPDTLRELRSAWAQVDAAPHVHDFLDMHDVGDAVVRAGFASPVLDVERFTLSYSDFQKVAADLRATGARNAATTRRRGLSSPRKFAAMQAAYEKYRRDGRLPATYEVVFAHAWAPAPKERGLPKATEVPLEEIKRQLKLPRRR
jgi:malonyl-CoA O-methyltransferase